MSRRRTERPIERLRSSLTSTADLEETIAAMFHVPSAEGAAPQAGAGEAEGETPTGGGLEATPVGESKEPDAGTITGAVSETGTVGVSETGTGETLEPPPGDKGEMPAVGISEIATGGDSRAAPVELAGMAMEDSELSPGGDFETPPPPEALDIRRLHLRPVRTVADGLTPGEFLLLTEMYRAGAEEAGSRDRILSGGGYRTLGGRTGQDPKTVKRNRVGLCRKFCIAPLSENTFTAAARYRIFGFDTILARWRQRGLLWVRRAGRSVELMAEGEMGPVGETPAGAIPKTGTVGVSEMGTGETATGGIPAFPWRLALEALFENIGYASEEAARQIARAILKRVPDASDGEVAYFIRREARSLPRRQAGSNPVAELLGRVAARFGGDGLAHFRAEYGRHCEAEAVRQRERVAEARRILEDAGSWDADREWAREFLARHGGEGKRQG